jgi:hypothetical protein
MEAEIETGFGSVGREWSRWMWMNALGVVIRIADQVMRLYTSCG